MSLQALIWAFDCRIRPASTKLVLLALADHANSGDEIPTVWPSLEALVAKTSLDRKTVIRALDVLESAGFLKDTGERRGTTRRVKVYALPAMPNSPRMPPFKQSRFSQPNGSKNGTIKQFRFRHSESGRGNQERKSGKQEVGKTSVFPPSEDSDWREIMRKAAASPFG